MELNTFIPKRFKFIISLVFAYAVAIAVTLIFKSQELPLGKLLTDTLRYSYPIATTFFTIAFYNAWKTTPRKRILYVVLPFFPLSAAWMLVYFMLYRLL